MGDSESYALGIVFWVNLVQDPISENMAKVKALGTQMWGNLDMGLMVITAGWDTGPRRRDATSQVHGSLYPMEQDLGLGPEAIGTGEIILQLMSNTEWR